MSQHPCPNPPHQPDISSSPSPQHHPTPTAAAITTPPPPQQFSPFFTLLTTHSPRTGAAPSTHHPTVTYTFASDPPDTSAITAAALRSVSPAQSSPASPQSTTTTRAHPRERCVLLDMDATGTKVLAAQSMSPDWAVVGTEVGPAPHWEGEGAGAGDGGGGGGGDRGLMLRIEGVEAAERVGREDGGKRLEQLVEEYESGMRELRRVVEANGYGDTGYDEGAGEGEGKRSSHAPM